MSDRHESLRKVDDVMIENDDAEDAEPLLLDIASLKAQLKRNPWDILITVIGFALWLALGIYSTKLLVYLSHLLFGLPATLEERSNLAGVLIAIPLLFSIMGPAFMVSNFLINCIPAARQFFENRAQVEYVVEELGLILPEYNEKTKRSILFQAESLVEPGYFEAQSQILSISKRLAWLLPLSVAAALFMH